MSVRDQQATEHEARLDRLAEVTVKVGLNLAPGQQVIMQAPIEALPLARRITEHAYRAGASMVTALLSDGEMVRARYVHASEPSFDTAANWLFDGMARGFQDNAARLGISGEDPDLLNGLDVDRISRANQSHALAYKPAREYITSSAVNWSIVPCATPAWARRVYPDLPEEQALQQLWDAVFAATRVHLPDPVANWHSHNAELSARRAILDAKRYSALHFRGPGTDLIVGLADGHLWKGGRTTAKNGISGNPNIPTEEVFTTPHARKVEGWVSATKPLSYSGTLIRDIRVRFEHGKVAEAHASSGLALLERMLGIDDGASRLGEVALVPQSSPIAQSGLLFFNTLFDENAASHIALGQSYEKCIQTDGADGDELARRGANTSVIHVDWMIGSGQVSVDGLGTDGTAEPVMRNGEWVSPAA